MTRADSKDRLPGPAEELLESWPVPAKDEREWEQSAETIMARVAMVRTGSTDDALLAPPLPASSPNGASQISLAELARSVAAESAANDAKDLARETLSAAARTRSKSPRASQQVELELPPPSAQVQAPAARPRSKRRFGAPMIAAGLAVVGIAAAAAIVLQAHERTDTVAALPVAGPELPAQASPTALEREPTTDAVKPGELPLSQAPRGASKGAPVPAASKPRDTTGPATAEPDKLASSPEAKDDKEAAKMKPAAQPNAVPQQPSNGAAQAAVAQVIGSARACVAGQEAPSHATLVFASDGRVQSVSVSGPAAGTPAESCIRAALSGARVEPFAKPTFSVGATIRP